MIKLKDLLNEELIGKYKDTYEVFKNPKSIKRMEPGIRGISFPNGDLFVIDDAWYVTHSMFHKWLVEQGYKIKYGQTLKDLAENIKIGYIDWQREGKSNNFYLSESTMFEDSLYLFKDELMPPLKKYSKKVKAKNSKYNFILKRIEN